MLLTSLLLAAAALTRAAPAQHPLQHPILAASDDEISTFSHHHFPGHKIRAVQPKHLAEHSVKQWSGYLDTPNNRHFYFWFFESRSDPENDPVVLWFNGGPGCSSATGNVMELGPIRVSPPDASGTVSVERNPYSWINNASIIFIDQPVGVGYSYAEKGDKGVWTTEAAAEDVYAFVQIWLKSFDREFHTNPFHMAGESFAGRYIPVFSDYIVQQNKKDNGLPTIRLSSIMIGNGMTHPRVQYPAYHTAVCTNTSGYGPFVSEKACKQMADALPKCNQLMEKCAEDQSNSIICLSAATYCEKTQTEPFYKTGRNAYDMEKFGDYDEEAWMATWLNQPSTIHALGIDKLSHHHIKAHTGCDPTVGYKFAATGDGAKPSYQHVANVLDSGVAALLYSGDRDFICNAIGNEQWIEQLEWSGGDDFRKTSSATWYGKPEDKKLAGKFRTAGNLTFATVHDSGHFVPFDKPEESLNMFNAWVHHGPAAFEEVLAKRN